MINADLLSILLIALGLSADCFAVALSGSITMKNLSLAQVGRVSSSFGFFQFLMPVVGWFAGQILVNAIASYDHWIAFALLAFVGGKMLWESLHHKENAHEHPDISRGFTLLFLSVATSIDALAVGFSFAFLKMNIMVSSITIGIVAFLVTATGFYVGRLAGKSLGKRAEIVGGLILIAIGFRILLTHLLA